MDLLLGVLAGDTIRSAARSQQPMVAISLLHCAGHVGFWQQFADSGSPQRMAFEGSGFCAFLRELSK